MENFLRTIQPENHENFMNGKPRLQFYWFLLKEKSVFNELRIKFYLHSYISLTSHLIHTLKFEINLIRCGITSMYELGLRSEN